MSLPRAVLAVLLLDPGRIAEAAELLEPADSGDEVNRTIYTAMLRLHSVGKSIDITLVVGDTTLSISSTFVREKSAPIC
jgi:replicative DNA helicase